MYLVPVGSEHDFIWRTGREKRALMFKLFRLEDLEQNAALFRPVKVDFNQVRHWLSLCESEHGERCNAAIKVPSIHHLELMVMTCVEHRMIMLPKGDRCYATLSYVWGSSPPSCSLDLGSEIDISLLERTIRDAITVNLELGLRYLWVDRYCISQNSIAERDLQLQQMGEIYSNLFITIIACAGSDAETGLPGVGTTSRNNNTDMVTPGHRTTACCRDN